MSYERVFIVGLNDMPADRPSKRHFTEAARAAALEARRRKREQALPSGIPEVFVIRRPIGGRGYGWEIRRFGGVILDRSSTHYSTMQGARFAGHSALTIQMCEA